jgi:hypothetical protein
MEPQPNMIEETSAQEVGPGHWRRELTIAVDEIRRHLRMQDEGTARIEKNLAILSHLVTGNGTPERGIIVRLDRVENAVSELRRTLHTVLSWFLKPAAGAVGLAAVAALAFWIARFGLAR